MGVKIEYRGVQGILQGMSDAAGASDIFRVAAAIIRESSVSNFAFGGRPKWPALSSKSTLKPRKKGQKIKNRRPLNKTGRLASSISSDYDQHGARVFTNVDYAPTHQYGAKKGEYGPNKPWGDVPERSFLKYQNADLRTIEKEVLKIIIGR